MNAPKPPAHRRQPRVTLRADTGLPATSDTDQTPTQPKAGRRPTRAVARFLRFRAVAGGERGCPRAAVGRPRRSRRTADAGGGRQVASWVSWVPVGCPQRRGCCVGHPTGALGGQGIASDPPLRDGRSGAVPRAAKRVRGRAGRDGRVHPTLLGPVKEQGSHGPPPPCGDASPNPFATCPSRWGG